MIALWRRKRLMEQRANVIIHEIETIPGEIRIYCSPVQSFFVIGMTAITAIAVIAGAIGIPITAWFVTHPSLPEGPFGLPQWFWVGVGIAIPIFGLALTVFMLKR